MHVTERSDVNDRHQAGDFLQEDCLGRVISFLNTGLIFSHETFSHAVRKCQRYQEGERSKGNHGPTTQSKRPKYTLEIQMMAALVLDLNEDPDVDMNIGDLSEDILDLTRIGMDNFDSFPPE